LGGPKLKGPWSEEEAKLFVDRRKSWCASSVKEARVEGGGKVGDFVIEAIKQNIREGRENATKGLIRRWDGVGS